MILKPWSEAATIRTVDNRNRDNYVLQLVLERDALRDEVQRLRGLLFGDAYRARQAMKGTVRHE